MIHTRKILGKLERIVEFRLGEKSAERHKIVVQAGSSSKGMSGPATDGSRIFLPRGESHFRSDRENELCMGNYADHEASHIREYEEYFSPGLEGMPEEEPNLVMEFLRRNYADLTENPALAAWIDNIVKDRRIDAGRRQELPGVERLHQETYVPVASYFRPSIKAMSELDAFREQYLQQALLGNTVEPVLEKNRKLLEEIVAITQTARTIFEDREVVRQIYQKFKEHFDITPPISKLPPLFGTGNHSQTPGTPQQGYGGQAKPREGRDKDEKKPGGLSDEDDKPKDEQPGENDLHKNRDKNKDGSGKKGEDRSEKNGTDGSGKEDRNNIYDTARKRHNIEIYVVQYRPSEEAKTEETLLKEGYTGEIESMKRIFRHLILKNYGDRRDYEGQNLEYDDYLQTDLERRVTGIAGHEKFFMSQVQNKQKPAWAVLADISGSTDPGEYNIIRQIKAGLLIHGESLGVTDYPFGLFAFSEEVYIIKDFPERYGPPTANKILTVRRESSGTILGPSLRVVGSLLSKQQEQPKGITIITDGESQNMDDARKAMNEMFEQKMYPFLIIIGKKFEKSAQALTADIGHEHYSIVERERLHELPGEMFRLFKTYGIAR
ncbi:MAG: VWA domain-containing protein [Nanoarchaeota archaeon]